MKDYILGTDPEELQRLGFQHRVWSKDAFALWERAGLGQGQRILDLGCGPGFATFDLAAIAGPSGKVVGVDISPNYIAHARAHAKAINQTNVEFVQSAFDDLQLEPQSFDAIYTRWAFAWIPNVADVVQRTSALLKPGGVFLCQEYVRWGTFRLVPDRPAVKRVIDAALESWRRMNSEIDIGPLLPAMFRSNGLDVAHVASIGKVTQPGQMAWQWVSTFLDIYSLKLIDMGLLTTTEREEFLKIWPQVERDPNSMVMAPTVMEVMAQRPR